MKAKRFDLVHLLLERKQTFWFGTKKKNSASRAFPFWPKNSGTKESNFIWSGNCLRLSRTFLFNPKSNRLKQNILIWFAYYRNESKTFWFGPKKMLSQSVRFCLGPLGQSKAIWYGLEIVLGNAERFYLIQKLRDRSKTLWFGLVIIGTRAKRFDLVCLLSERKQNNLIWSVNYTGWQR